MQVERVYQSKRIVAGLYIQPANDGKRLFVIASYEDGRLNGLTEGPWFGTYWGWGQLSDADGKRIERLTEHDPDEALSELRWLAQNDGYQSRREAVEAALKS